MVLSVSVSWVWLLIATISAVDFSKATLVINSETIKKRNTWTRLPGPKWKEKYGDRKKKLARMPESKVTMTAGPKPHRRAVSATAAKKKKKGSRSPTMGKKFAANAANTKNSARPYRSAGLSRYKSTPASRCRSPSIATILAYPEQQDGWKKNLTTD